MDRERDHHDRYGSREEDERRRDDRYDDRRRDDRYDDRRRDYDDRRRDHDDRPPPPPPPPPHGSYGGGGGYDGGGGHGYPPPPPSYDGGGYYAPPPPQPHYGGGGGGGGGYHNYGGGGGGGSSSVEPISEQQILALIEERNTAKLTRDFDKADSVRDQLRGYGVTVDDKAKTWSCTDGRRGEVFMGGGRGDKRLDDGSMSWENTVYVAGLPPGTTLDQIADFFGQLGPIKKSKKNFNLGEPTIHVYKDKRTGEPKGDATVSYEDVETAQSAVKWYDGQSFMGRSGSRLSVSIAKRPAQDRFGGKGKGGGKGGGGKGGRY